MREVGQPLSTRIVQPILKGIIQSFASQFIRPGCGGFSVTREWSRQFMKQYMCWTYKVATTITSKLPPNWVTQGLTMVYKVAYLAKAYSIPPVLVVSNDQLESI
jgi:hypothetical protein